MDLKSFTQASRAFTDQAKGPKMFKEFDATELYCPRCKRAVPVRKRLLLILPEGDKYEYICSFCAESIGMKIDRHERPITLIA
ncbi:MAG: hypothetical protein JW786_04265 [Desulfobacterales bacterium]|nr:hypothetical protein [Desulfobacterales bacterium]